MTASSRSPSPTTCERSLDATDRARGALLGLAAGEALGGPVEFLDAREILARYGTLRDIVGGGADCAPREPGRGPSLALAVAHSLLDRHAFDPDDVLSRFLTWFDDHVFAAGEVLSTTLRHYDQGYPWEEASRATNDELGTRTAGNGAMVYSVPLAIWQRSDREALTDVTYAASRLIYWSPIAAWSSVAVNIMVAELIQGDFDNYRRTAISAVKRREVASTLENAPDMSGRKLRTSTFALDTLAVATWALTNSTSAEDAIVRAVNLGGETTVQGAVTGALAGARYGAGALPARWLEAMRDSELFVETADHLFHLDKQEQKF